MLGGGTSKLGYEYVISTQASKNFMFSYQNHWYTNKIQLISVAIYNNNFLGAIRGGAHASCTPVHCLCCWPHIKYAQFVAVITSTSLLYLLLVNTLVFP